MADKPKANFGKELRQQGTPAERVLWSKLRNKQLAGVKFRRQQPIGNYIVDFVSFGNKLIIELDGGQHTEDLKMHHDETRTAWLNGQGFLVMRFWNNEVLENLEGVLQRVRLAVNIESPSPFNPSPIKGEGNGKFSN